MKNTEYKSWIASGQALAMTKTLYSVTANYEVIGGANKSKDPEKVTEEMIHEE
jgi:hypothetical protein